MLWETYFIILIRLQKSTKHYATKRLIFRLTVLQLTTKSKHSLKYYYVTSSKILVDCRKKVNIKIDWVMMYTSISFLILILEITYSWPALSFIVLSMEEPIWDSHSLWLTSSFSLLSDKSIHLQISSGEMEN